MHLNILNTVFDICDGGKYKFSLFFEFLILHSCLVDKSYETSPL